MKKLALTAMLLFSIAMTAEAARKNTPMTQPVDSYSDSEVCPSYGCNEGGDGGQGADDQSSMETYVPGSGTYEGNDRDTGSDYINGMPY